MGKAKADRYVPGLRVDKDKARLFEAYTPVRGIEIPDWLDFRPLVAPASNQGSTPWCVVFSFLAVFEYEDWRISGKCKQLDFFAEKYYLMCKDIDGIRGDGTTLEAGFEVGKKLGFIEEGAKPYLLNTPEQLDRAMHLRMAPCPIAMNVHESLGNAGADGWYTGEGREMGGHAMCATGHDVKPDGAMPFRSTANSWGRIGYGWYGHVRMPYKVFARDFIYGLDWFPRRI